MLENLRSRKLNDTALRKRPFGTAYWSKRIPNFVTSIPTPCAPSSFRGHAGPEYPKHDTECRMHLSNILSQRRYICALTNTEGDTFGHH